MMHLFAPKTALARSFRRLLQRFCQFLHPSWHFYAGIAGIVAGTALELLLHPDLPPAPVWLVVALLLWLMAICCPRAYLLVVAFLAGCLLAHCRIQPEFASQAQLTRHFGTTVTLCGKIVDDPERRNSLATLHLGQLAIAGTTFRGTLYVQLPASVEFGRSDSVTLTGKLNAGFGTYVGSLYRPQLVAWQKPDPPDYFVRLKRWFGTQVHQYIASPAAELGLGYLMGQKSGLPEDLSSTLQLVGMTHVVVASGAHLGILVGVARRIFGKLSRFAGTLAALLMMGAFVMIVGFTPSMTRAALVTSLTLLMGYVGRRFTPWRLLLLVAAATLLINPYYLLNLGWQLSFASFFGILILAPTLTKLLYGGKKVPWLASMLTTSIATSLACAPLLVYSFGSISFLALVANLIILPTLPYAMLLVFLTGVSSFLPWLAMVFGRLAGWLLEFHIAVVNLLSTQKSFVLELEASDLRIFWLYLLVILPLLCYNIIYCKRIRRYDYPLRE